MWAEPTTLHQAVNQLAKSKGASRISVAFYDYERGTHWDHNPPSLFQAASTIKVPILIALFAEIERGRFQLDTEVSVRNSFKSLVDGSPYSILREEGVNGRVHDAIGDTMSLRELAQAMITSSSNLATNVLLEAVGLERAKEDIAGLKVSGIELLRGLGDEKAFAQGMNNRVSAEALVKLFQLLSDGKAVSPVASSQMMELFLKQQLPSNVRAGLPQEVRAKARLAWKTGYTSSVSHEIALVAIPGRRPYVFAIMTEWPTGKRSDKVLSDISRLIYDTFVRQEKCYEKQK